MLHFFSVFLFGIFNYMLPLIILPFKRTLSLFYCLTNYTLLCVFYAVFIAYTRFMDSYNPYFIRTTKLYLA